MEHIIFPTQDFDFSKVTLQNPEVIQGGSYFCKLLCNDNDFLLQTPKCYTKNGIITTGKKVYSDLCFSQDNTTLSTWLQHLEKHLHILLHEKKDIWFQNEMSLDDIEYLFSNSCRSYKDGFLIRTFLKQSRNFRNLDNFIVYDDNENKLSFDDVSKEDKVISILQITGIKFNDNDFKLDFTLKQMMVFKNSPSFSKCVINHNILEEPTESTNLHRVETLDINVENTKKVSLKLNNPLETETYLEETSTLEKIKPSVSIVENHLESETKPLSKEEPLELNQCIFGSEVNHQAILEDEKNTQDLFETPIENENNNFSLKEVNLEVLSNDKPIVLKQPSEVYLEIYRSTLERAKDAKEIALRTFFEAENIKNTYLLAETEGFLDEQEFLEGLVEK